MAALPPARAPAAAALRAKWDDCGQPRTDSPTAGRVAVDADAIFRSIGEVPYDWRLDTDELQWGANAGRVLGISDPGLIGSGRAFAQLVDPKSGPTRFDAVVRSTSPDDGAGVPYQVEYALRRAGADGLLWVEDTGRWFAGPDGKPLRAHGVLRVGQRAP